ncbi:MAG: hypothetical protein R2844_21250 [Caldilineales bacterium]
MFRYTDSMAAPRASMTATLLDNDYFFSVATALEDGSVLITGGYDAGIQPTDQVWRYLCGCRRTDGLRRR